MRVLGLFLGAALVSAPGLARAMTIYDTVDIDPQAFNVGSDTVDPSLVGLGPLAASFSVAYPETLDSVALELSAANPNDGGSLSVVLISDNNHKPYYQTANDVTTFTNDTVLATILDSSLSAAPSLLTINTAVNLLSAGTYWIGIETSQLSSSVQAGDSAADGTYGSAQWWNADSDPTGAIGLAGQSDFNTADGPPLPFPVGGNAGTSLGPFEMIVDVPEPATLAVLSGGLAGLGYLRRRKARKA